jgi:hypothetical protein
VKFLRSENRPLRQAAWALGLALGTLEYWDHSFDEHLAPYRTADLRGKAGKLTVALVKKVVEAACALKADGKRLRIKPFTHYLNRQLGLDLGRKTVAEILIANDLFKAESRRKRPRFYQNLCQRIPNGLLSIDGSELSVYINEQVLKFNVELAVDTGSFCHTGFGIHATETAEAVIEVLDAHRRRWASPLGVVFDHGSANLSAKVSRYLDACGIAVLPAGPANPKGNGTDEGAFSQMKKALGTIRIDASSPRALAQSVLEKLVALYVQLRNQMALRKAKTTPSDQMLAPVSDAMRDQERQRLAAHKQARNAEDASLAKLQRLSFLINHFGLNAEPAVVKRAQHCIRYYDLEAIGKSETAFLKAIKRDPNRRSLAYFFGIVRNIQQQIDDERYQLYCRQRYNHQLMLQTERQYQQQQQQLAGPTIESIVAMAAKAVSKSAQFVKELAQRKVRQWTHQLLAAVDYVGPLKKKILDAIGALKDLDENQKERVWKMIEQFLTQKTEAESVTLVS